MVLLRPIAVAGFYPTAARPDDWHWLGNGWVDVSKGLRVTDEGLPEQIGAVESMVRTLGIPPGGAVAAAMATVLAGLALPMLVGHAVLWRADPVRHGRADAAAAAVAVLGSILLFQAAAARLLPAMVGALPPLALLAWAVQRYRSRV
jgi:hypothetical protein